MKNLLLHIVTPIVGIISWVVFGIFGGLVLKFTQYINCMSDWFVENMTFLMSMLAVAAMVNITAPSKKILHFLFVSVSLNLIVIFITIFYKPEEYSIAPAILSTIGLVAGVFYIKIQRGDYSKHTI